MQMMTISLNSTFLISENTLFFCLNLMNFFFFALHLFYVQKEFIILIYETYI